MNNLDNQLKELYKRVLAKKRPKTDRTGVGTKSIFGNQMRVNLQEGFPLTTLRKIHIKSMIHEMLWFLESYDEKYDKFGNTNIRYLIENGVSFWTEWPYQDYKKRILDEFNRNPKRKKLNIMCQKDFEKRIINDDDFALKYGDLGPVYGKQWMDFGGYDELIEIKEEYKETNGQMKLVDSHGYKKVHISGLNQINKVINTLIENPDSRRIIVNAWKPDEVEDAMLPPCHILFQFYTEILEMEERIQFCKDNYTVDEIYLYMRKIDINDWDSIERQPLKQIKILEHFNVPERFIDLQLYQRSQDLYLGNPYNIASYSILLTMIAQIVNMVPRDFVHTIGDVHLYTNSIEATEQLLDREVYDLPKLTINKEIQNIKGFRYEDFQILDYKSHANIKVEVAI